MRKYAIIALTAALTFLLLTSEASAAEWTKSTYRLRDGMVELGFQKSLATYVIGRCKQEASDPRHCVVTATFIAQAESECGKSARNHNVWGINEGAKYATDEANFERWLSSYLKYWHKTKSPSDFYPKKGQYSKTRYCTSEHSSRSRVGCPNGLKNSTKAFSYIRKIAYNRNHE